MAKDEQGFLKFIVKPLWDSLNAYCQNSFSQICLNLLDSIENWHQIQLENTPKEKEKLVKSEESKEEQ